MEIQLSFKSMQAASRLVLHWRCAENDRLSESPYNSSKPVHEWYGDIKNDEQAIVDDVLAKFTIRAAEAIGAPQMGTFPAFFGRGEDYLTFSANPQER